MLKTGERIPHLERELVRNRVVLMIAQIDKLNI